MTTPTPIIQINSATEIKWMNAPVNPDPMGLNFSVRVDIYKGTSFLRREDIFAVADLVLSNLASGDYSIKFRIGWDSDPDSEFSNIVSLVSQASAKPTVTSHDDEVINGIANIVLGGVLGAEMYYTRNAEQPQYIGIVGANGVKNYSHSIGGSYKYFQIETGKSQSEFTNTIQIVDATITQIIDYYLDSFEACSVLTANIEFGSSAINDANTATDWTQDLVITKDISLVADSTFFWIRDKNNPAAISAVFEKL